jgi:hypothetical protein
MLLGLASPARPLMRGVVELARTMASTPSVAMGERRDVLLPRDQIDAIMIQLL